MSDRNRAIRWACLALTLAASFAHAENLPDPTRPPAALGSLPDAAMTMPSVGPVLQSVLISPTRMVAIISGQTVQVGDKFGDARVVKITESEVILRNGKDVQSLKLFPDVEKRLSSGSSDVSAEHGGNKGKL